MGQEVAFPSITHELFQFGVSDAILQMWAAYLYELDQSKPLSPFSGCTRPDETALWHKLFTAALESQAGGKTVPIPR